MIQTVRFEGYRSLKDVTWNPGKLNVVIGPNGSGKSNLLRALSLLQRSALGELPRDIVKQGGIAPILWDGRAPELAWTVTAADPGDGGRNPDSLTYELRLRRLGATSAYRVEHELLAKRSSGSKDPGAESTPTKLLERRPGHAAVLDLQERQLLAHEGSIPDDQTLLSLVSGPFSNHLVSAFRETLAAWSIFHDVHVDQDAEVRRPAVARIDNRVAADGQNLIPVLHTLYTGHREFKQDVDMAMKAAFGSDFEEISFPPAADQRVQLRLRWRSLNSTQSASDLSDGTIRFLLLLAVLGNPRPDALIAIDEPEAGLHPAMLPIVAELARQAADRSQVILTTHSPQLLDAFGDEPPTTTTARWENGETRLSVIEGDELGRWLKEYSLGALFRSGELEGMA
ncbi:MAG: AAA family ATPase [Pseudomonadota bacterium]